MTTRWPSLLLGALLVQAPATARAAGDNTADGIVKARGTRKTKVAAKVVAKVARPTKAQGLVGTITYVGTKNGYSFAFLKPDNGAKDVFVPGQLLTPAVTRGTRVLFEKITTERGDQASRITFGIKLPDPPAKPASTFLNKPANVGKTKSRYLKWKAPRGDDGKAPPDGDQWTTFLGETNAKHAEKYKDPTHATTVPLKGIVKDGVQPTKRTLTVKQVEELLVKRGVAKVIAKKAALRVQLGLPSGANVKAEDDYLIARKDSVMSYSSTRKSPNWVSWTTSTDDLGTTYIRSDDKWRADPVLPSGFGFTTFHDYKGSGYDPGHLIMSAERTRSLRANERTFLTSNAIPQAFNNNRGPWLRFENYYRDTLKANNLEAHVIAGGTYGEKPLTIGKGVPVPNATWKIVVLLPKGQTMADINEETRVVSILTPNNDKQLKTTDSFRKFLTTPGEIERLTGLRFFDSLPKKLADRLRETKSFNFGYREIPERGFD